MNLTHINKSHSAKASVQKTMTEVQNKTSHRHSQQLSYEIGWGIWDTMYMNKICHIIRSFLEALWRAKCVPGKHHEENALNWTFTV